MSSYLERLNTLPVEIIEDFRITGKSSAIPKELQRFIIELEAVLEIKETNRFDNITRLAKQLRVRYPELPLRTAKQRVYDAYSFFSINDNVANHVWNHIYADKMEDLAQLLIAKGNEQAARNCFLDAHRLRTKEDKGINPEDLQRHIYIISNKIKSEELGFKDKNMKDIARKHNDGKYIEIINAITESKKERKSLCEDAEIINDDNE